MAKNIPPTAKAGQKNNEADMASLNSALENADKASERTYRTRNNAGTLSAIPDRLPVITSSTFQNALTFNKNSSAYLQPLSKKAKLQYKSGVLLLDGLPVTSAGLSSPCKNDEAIEKFNLTLLRVLYGIILIEYPPSLPESRASSKKIEIYYPDFARKIGKSPNIGKEDVNEFVSSIRLFETVVGIINNGTENRNILPVLVFRGYDDSKNVISFSSPYMERISKDIYESGFRKKGNGEVMLRKDGWPQMLPTYSYLIDISIAKERNRKAVEIVFTVVVLIEQSGNKTPHIRASTVIDRNPLLHKSLDGQTSGNKNNLLKRAFSKAWQLLREKTFLTQTYKNIRLPDPDDEAVIPTASTLGMVFSFPHEGKAKIPESRRGSLNKTDKKSNYFGG